MGLGHGRKKIHLVLSPAEKCNLTNGVKASTGVTRYDKKLNNIIHLRLCLQDTHILDANPSILKLIKNLNNYF